VIEPPFSYVERGEVWPGQLPTSSGGSFRPILNLRRPYLTCHYTGAGIWADFGDTIPESRSIQLYAVSAKKPWEYNFIVDTEGTVVEYAGFYQAAHSEGENALAIGVLWLLGPGEQPTPKQVLAFRQLRWWLVQGEWLAPDHRPTPHKDMPGAATVCPGPVMSVWAEATTPWTPELDMADSTIPPIIWQDPREEDQYLVYPTLSDLTPAIAKFLLEHGAVKIDEAHDKMRASVRHRLGRPVT
jgi:hypothetical protein